MLHHHLLQRFGVWRNACQTNYIRSGRTLCWVVLIKDYFNSAFRLGETKHNPVSAKHQNTVYVIISDKPILAFSLKRPENRFGFGLILSKIRIKNIYILDNSVTGAIFVTVSSSAQAT